MRIQYTHMRRHIYSLISLSPSLPLPLPLTCDTVLGWNVYLLTPSSSFLPLVKGEVRGVEVKGVEVEMRGMEEREE